MTKESVEHIAEKLNQNGGASAWWKLSEKELTPPSALLPNGESEFIKGTDIMDVWFDSGTSWTSLPGDKGGIKADLCIEGGDQHRGWFQSQLLTSGMF
jgi:isoleucyl-tRNA synthetase